MASIPKRLDRYLKQPYNKNDVIGFLSLYLIFVFLIPYLTFNYMSFEMFITYFANVDIIANVLSVNYPDYFIKWYTHLLHLRSKKFLNSPRIFIPDLHS